MSPGFTSRPSLSVRTRRALRRSKRRVAGIHVPAFVERAAGRARARSGGHVSPGFTSRPSLSVAVMVGPDLDLPVSPGFTSRPSLSEPGLSRRRDGRPRVAGIHVPAFVERCRRLTPAHCGRPRVAGIHVPAFVERRATPVTTYAAPGVAGIHVPAFVERRSCRSRSSWRASVAGIHVPAFVERRRPGPRHAHDAVGVAGIHVPAFVERLPGSLPGNRP